MYNYFLGNNYEYTEGFMILSCDNISKSFGAEDILKEISFHIEDHEKAAITGINGAGKSTLLKIIVGEITPDGGAVHFPKDKQLGYLAQRQDFEGSRGIFDELASVKEDLHDIERQIRDLELAMKSASETELPGMLDKYTRLTKEFEDGNGYAIRSEVTGILKGLGFQESEFGTSVDVLSGGQKTRLSLGRLLLSKPDLLLLDEPTNHLDLRSVAWLETYLKNYKGAVIVIAHDRYFLDRVATKIIEIENGSASTFAGNYTNYASLKGKLREEQVKAYLNQRKEIQRQEAVITRLKSFNREKSIKRAESREKALAKVSRLEKPIDLRDEMRIRLTPAVQSGNDVLTIDRLSKSYPGHKLFSDVSFTIHRGERVAIIGDNGTGKTTLLKIITGREDAVSGLVTRGSNVTIGYYDQEHQVLHYEKTLFDEISDTYPDMSQTLIRDTLAAFLFTGDDVFKRVEDLSGGERGRLSLAKLMLSEANFLILDEPTNHLDMVSREILENALNDYDGTVLFVSHDRYFINRTATRVLELSGNAFTEYLGDYDYYLEKKAEKERLDNESAASSESDAANVSAAKMDWQSQKEETARERKRLRDIERAEKEIDRLEKRSAEIDDLLCQREVATDPAACVKLSKEQEEIQKSLDDYYILWEKLQEER